MKNRWVSWRTLATAVLFFLSQTTLDAFSFSSLLAQDATVAAPANTPQDVEDPISDTQNAISVQLIAENTTIQPKKTFWVMLKFQIQPDWHLYWKNPGDAGVPPQIQWTLPTGFQAGDVLWPIPARIEVGSSVIYGYSDSLDLLIPISPPDFVIDGAVAQIKADVSWVGCSSICVPGKASLELKLVENTAQTEINQEVAPEFYQARKRLAEVATQVSMQIFKDVLQIEIPLSPEKTAEIQGVSFLPEQQGLFDPRLLPLWKVSDNSKMLIVQLKQDNLGNQLAGKPLKAVIVAEYADNKKSAWTIDTKIPEIARAVASQNSASQNHASNATVPQASPSQPTTPQTSASQNTTLQNISKYGKQQTVVPSTTTPNAASKIEALENRIWYRKLLDMTNDLAESSLSHILLLAFIGGMLLNIMPCVLPVISLKVLHFVQLGGESKKATAKHGLTFSIGIIVSFWLLAGSIFALQSAGKTIGWGFQLQEPLFVAVLLLILFMLTLSLFGVFEFGTGIAAQAANLDVAAQAPLEAEHKHSLLASFWSGVLATFVASPCTGPLLGSALGFAATLHPLYAFVVFTALGFGMAFPYLFLSLFPGLTSILPRPGRWMITFKQLMGFLMMATVLWLVWVLEAEVPQMPLFILLLSLFVVALGLWIYGTWGGLDRGKATRHLARFLALIVTIAGCYILIARVYQARKMGFIKNETTQVLSQEKVIGKNWEPFSPARIIELRKQKIPVFVDFSAKWCLTCQANGIVLDLPEVKQAFVQYGVVKMLADWTQGDPEITKFLRSLGRNGVPVYALYSKNPDDAPVLLPEVITPDMVISSLKKLHDESPLP